MISRPVCAQVRVPFLSFWERFKESTHEIQCPVRQLRKPLIVVKKHSRIPKACWLQISSPETMRRKSSPRQTFFGIITRQAICRGTFTSVKDLIAAIGTFINGWNERCEPLTWTKTVGILTHAHRQKSSNTHR